MSFILSPMVGAIKDVVSLSTPIVVAVAGWIINRSVQRRNRIAERSSALATQWANDFASLTKDINDIATSVLFAYWKYKYLEIANLQVKLQAHIQKMNADLPEWAISLKQRGYEMERFLGFSPKHGAALQKSFEALETIVGAFLRNQGGNLDEFRAAQLDFNRSARSAHEELLQSGEE
jgi:hypothetical protein